MHLTRTGQGVLEGAFVPEEPGTYKFVVMLEGRELASSTVNVLGPSDDGDDGISMYVYYTLGALVLFGIALLIALKRRG